jgi:hypothetical protein
MNALAAFMGMMASGYFVYVLFVTLSVPVLGFASIGLFFICAFWLAISVFQDARQYFAKPGDDVE